jgi:predicted GNAT family acetyltransferase
MTDVTHSPDRHRFEVIGEGAAGVATAVLTYSRGDDHVRLEHTVVPDELEGQGVGSALARAALDWARAEGLAVVPQCSFVRSYLERHPEAAEGLELRPH